MGFIRLLLAISVIIAHSTGSIFDIKLVGGPIAVETFFIISGFYMALILEEKYFLHKNAFKLFITNRFLKLYPMYWVVLLLTVIASMIIPFRFEIYEEWFHFMDIFPKIYIVLLNMGMFFQDTLLFMGLDKISGGFYFSSDFRQTSPQLQEFLLIPQAWTIGLELLFYFFAPFFARLKTLTIIVMVLLSILGRFFVYSVGFDNDPWTYRFFPFELAFFLAGMLSYRMYRVIREKNISKKILVHIYIFFIIVTIIFSFIDVLLYIKQWAYYGMTFLFLAPIFLLTKKSSFDRIIGDLSYPMYISHIFVITLISVLFQQYGPVMNNMGIIAVLSTMVFSYFLIKYIGYPIELIRERRLQA